MLLLVSVLAVRREAKDDEVPMARDNFAEVERLCAHRKCPCSDSWALMDGDGVSHSTSHCHQWRGSDANSKLIH